MQLPMFAGRLFGRGTWKCSLKISVWTRDNVGIPCVLSQRKLEGRHVSRAAGVGRPTATLTDMIVAPLHHITLYHFHERTSVNSLSLPPMQRFSFVVSTEECRSLQRFR